MRENHFIEIKALHPFNMAVVLPDIEEAEGDIKRPDFFAQGWIRYVRMDFVPVYST